LVSKEADQGKEDIQNRKSQKGCPINDRNTTSDNLVVKLQLSRFQEPQPNADKDGGEYT